MTDLFTALALVFVIEGCLWALFPDGMKRAAAQAMALPTGSLRLGGLVFAGVGVFLVWLMRG
ncbi:MAG TPA: DUF2065 domain-containing protein [Geminicoccaceae bacterium]|nr:DUF2065 domain-containing protein [Geminicoccaceae bacterium]